MDRVRYEQIDAARREHGCYSAPSLRVALLHLNTPNSTSGGKCSFQQGCMHAARGMSICRWRALEALFAAFPGPGRGCACRPLPEKREREALPGCLSPLARLRAPASHSPPGAHSTCACESSQPRPIRPHHLPPSAQPGPPGLRGRAGSKKQPNWGSYGPPYPGDTRVRAACTIAVTRLVRERGPAGRVRERELGGG